MQGIVANTCVHEQFAAHWTQVTLRQGYLMDLNMLSGLGHLNLHACQLGVAILPVQKSVGNLWQPIAHIS